MLFQYLDGYAVSVFKTFFSECAVSLNPVIQLVAIGTAENFQVLKVESVISSIYGSRNRSSLIL